MNGKIAKRLRKLSQELLDENDLDKKQRLYRKLKREYSKSTKSKSWGSRTVNA